LEPNRDSMQKPIGGLSTKLPTELYEGGLKFFPRAAVQPFRTGSETNTLLSEMKHSLQPDITRNRVWARKKC
jgi:hypothetical protein